MSSRKPALGFIFVTLLIDVTGWGIIIPVVPGLGLALYAAGFLLFALATEGWMM
jgi:hypothetical protein